MDTFDIAIPADLYQRIAAIAVRNEGESLTAVVERLVADCEAAHRLGAGAAEVVEGEVLEVLVRT